MCEKLKRAEKVVVCVWWASNEKVTLIGPTRFILKRYNWIGTTWKWHTRSPFRIPFSSKDAKCWMLNWKAKRKQFLSLPIMNFAIFIEYMLMFYFATVFPRLYSVTITYCIFNKTAMNRIDVMDGLALIQLAFLHSMVGIKCEKK